MGFMVLVRLAEGEPAGEVNAVAWKLLSGLAAIGTAAILWLTKRLGDKEAEIKELHAARLQDRKDFEAQTNVLMQAVLKKKGGTSP